MSGMTPPILRFDRLPVELISLIIYCAQITWQNEHFAAQAPYADVKRYEASQSGSVPFSVSPCCNGTRWDFSRPICIRSDSGKVLPPHLPSPAHSASLVSRRLRAVLLEHNSHIWQLDNTLYPGIARLSGEHRIIANGREVIQYGARSLIALDVCTCVLRGILPFYSSLERVKLRLPWPGDGTLTSDVGLFLHDTRGRANSHLRHVDVEAMDPDPLHVAEGLRRLMAAIESVGLLTSRASCFHKFYYSRTLTSLYLHQGPHAKVVFGASLSLALSACAGAIEFLTIDIAAGFRAELQGNITFPRLRYFRLCTHRTCAATLLGWMVLPSALDLHLEPVESWRKCFTAKHPGVYEVPFWPSEYAPEERFPGEWRWTQNFAKSVEEPHRTTTIHDATLPYHGVEIGDSATLRCWNSAAVIGLDVRIDLSANTHEPAAAKFPELVSLTMAESLQELRPVLQDPVGRDWERTDELDSKIAVRRSLTFRDGQFSTYDRERDFNSQYPHALYDTLGFVLFAIPTTWTLAAEELVIAKDSWVPDSSTAYQCVLYWFDFIEGLHLDSPALHPDAEFKPNIEGCVTADHLRALASSLNSPLPGYGYLCSSLERIHLCVPPETVMGWADDSNWDAILNSPGRLATGAQRIRLSAMLR
ncbi:unnamed protein product [Peniophora sp. CBMAI 1063]|nr:unnamed protein product [Peniophora sp. CBMAI 1063]